MTQQVTGFNPRPSSFMGVLAWAATEARLKGVPFCPLAGERVGGCAVEWLSRSFDAMSPTHKFDVEVTDLATGTHTTFSVIRKQRTYRATGRTTVRYNTPIGNFGTFDEVNEALVNAALAAAAAARVEVAGAGEQAEAYPVLGIDVLAGLSLGRTQQLEQRQMQLAAAPARPNLHARINARTMPRERVEAAARQVAWLERQKQAAYKKALKAGRRAAQRNLESWGCYEEDLGAGPAWRQERDAGAHEMALDVVEAGCWDGRIEHQQAVLRNALQEWGVQEGCPHWQLLEIQLRFRAWVYAFYRTSRGFVEHTPYVGAASLRSVAAYSRALLMQTHALPWSDGPHEQPEQQQAQRADGMTDASLRVLGEIKEERARQQAQEGWTPEHDDAHTDGDLAQAAATYALAAVGAHPGRLLETWPWDLSWLKATDPRRDLIKAGALIVAEIERLDRADGPHEQPEQQQAQALAVAVAPPFEPECDRCGALLDERGGCPVCAPQEDGFALRVKHGNWVMEQTGGQLPVCGDCGVVIVPEEATQGSDDRFYCGTCWGDMCDAASGDMGPEARWWA